MKWKVSTDEDPKSGLVLDYSVKSCLIGLGIYLGCVTATILGLLFFCISRVLEELGMRFSRSFLWSRQGCRECFSQGNAKGWEKKTQVRMGINNQR